MERGEERAVKVYHEALKKPLPEAIRDLVQDQATGAEDNLARVRSFQDTVH